MFISPYRRVLSLALLSGVVLFGAGAWYLTNPKRITRMSQMLLARVTGANVQIADARLAMSGTLQVTGVTIKSRLDGEPVPLLSADELQVRFHWLSLLTGNLEATQVTAVGPRLTLVEDPATHRWNYDALLPTTRPAGSTGPGVPKSLPVLVLRDARVEWAELAGPHVQTTGSLTVDAQFSPDATTPTLYHLHIEPRTGPAAAPGTVPIANVDGIWDLAGNSFSASMRNLALKDVQAALPREIRQQVEAVQLAGRLSLLRVSVSPEDGVVASAELDKVRFVPTLTPETTGARHAVTLPMRDVTGTIDFHANSGVMSVHDLHGMVAGQEVELNGQLGGADPNAPFTFTLAMPHIDLDERNYPSIVNAFAESRDVIERLRPGGRLRFGITLRRTERGGPIKLDGSVDCADVRARFAHFPYPIEHLAGHVWFDNRKVHFPKITGVAGESHILISGWAALGKPVMDVTASSNDLAVDEQLGAAIPQDFQPVWKMLAPAGVTAFSAHVWQGDGDVRQHMNVIVEPRDLSVAYENFPYPLQHATGRFVITDKRTTIEKMTAHCGPHDAGTIDFTGTVDYADGKIEDVQPRVVIKGRNIPVDRELLSALPPEEQAYVRPIDLTGLFDIDGTVTRGPDGAPALDAKLALHDGRLVTPQSPLVLRDVTANLAIKSALITLETMQGVTGPKEHPATVTLAGTLKQGDGVTIHAQGQWQGLTIDPQQPLLTNKTVSELWKKYQPAGPLDGSFRVALAAGRQALNDEDASALGQMQYEVRLEPKGMRVAAKSWPMPLHDITGMITLSPDAFGFSHLAAASDTLQLAADGAYDRQQKLLTLSGRVRGAALPDGWLTLMPESVTGFVTSAKLNAGIDLEVKSLSRETTPAGARWRFDGGVALTHMTTSGAFNSSADRLALSGRGMWDAAHPGLTVDARLSASNLVAAEKPIEELRAHVIGNAGEQTLRLENLDAKVAGGTMQGDMALQLGSRPRYTAQMVLNDAELARLMLPATATARDRATVGTGRVTANLALQGALGNVAERTGRGELVVRNGTIYNVPLALGLLQLVTLRLPVAQSFDAAHISYYLRDDTVTFEQILLESNGVNLAGLGDMNLHDMSLDLKFVTESPHEWQLPVLTPLVRGARNQLLQIRVTGPVADPHVQPAPLDALTSTLAALLPHRQASTQASIEAATQAAREAAATQAKHGLVANVATRPRGPGEAVVTTAPAEPATRQADVSGGE